jgi:hypothetical protein
MGCCDEVVVVVVFAVVVDSVRMLDVRVDVLSSTNITLRRCSALQQQSATMYRMAFNNHSNAENK